MGWLIVAGLLVAAGMVIGAALHAAMLSPRPSARDLSRMEDWGW